MGNVETKGLGEKGKEKKLIPNGRQNGSWSGDYDPKGGKGGEHFRSVKDIIQVKST